MTWPGVEAKPISLFAYGRHFITWNRNFGQLRHSHSQIWPYFISYLLTCKVDIFEVLEIMAHMWHYITFLSHKPTKVTSDFIVNYLKKNCRGSEKIENKYWNIDILFYMDMPQGTPGVSKDVPGSTKHTIWGLVR